MKNHLYLLSNLSFGFYGRKHNPFYVGYFLDRRKISYKVRVHSSIKNQVFVIENSGKTSSEILYEEVLDRKSTRLNSSHVSISYAVFCLKKKKYSHEQNSYHVL